MPDYTTSTVSAAAASAQIYGDRSPEEDRSDELRSEFTHRCPECRMRGGDYAHDCSRILDEE